MVRRQINQHPPGLHTHSTWTPEDEDGNIQCHVCSKVFGLHEKWEGQIERCEGCVHHSELEAGGELVLDLVLEPELEHTDVWEESESGLFSSKNCRVICFAAFNGVADNGL